MRIEENDDEVAPEVGGGDRGVGVRGGPGQIDWDEIEGGQGGESALGEEGQGDLDETEKAPDKVNWTEIEESGSLPDEDDVAGLDGSEKG